MVTRKRLFFDIETSPNEVYAWSIGRKISVGHESIKKERAIICICYKWENEDKVHSLTWKKGDDATMVYNFYDVIKKADEVIGHNSDNFDIKWFKTRCLYHGIKTMPKLTTIDTLKIARKEFKLNSNKLDYIGQFTKLGSKINTGGFELWKKIIENNDKQALEDMVKYCVNDVILLERVYKAFQGFSDKKTHMGVHLGNDKFSCPNCGSTNLKLSKTRISALGTVRLQYQCNKCHNYSTHSPFNT